MTSILSDLVKYCDENKISNLVALVKDGNKSGKLALMEVDI